MTIKTILFVLYRDPNGFACRGTRETSNREILRVRLRTFLTGCGIFFITLQAVHCLGQGMQNGQPSDQIGQPSNRVQQSDDNNGPNSSINAIEELPAPLTIMAANPYRGLPFIPRQIRLHDVVSIRVDELARMQAEGEVERRKNASLNAVIQSWVRLNGFRKAEPTAANNPRIQGQLDELFRAENGIETTERLTFNIAARVADIRPNGNIVLEARKTIQLNNEIWNAKLSGICRQQDIGPDNVLLSRNIIDLRIEKSDVGHIRDSTRRGWFLRILDNVKPF